MTTYDAIVVGTGGVGSATLFQLARRGLNVLGIDRFPGGHDQGSSHGQTRIIRQAYFEHSDYVPLLRRAYELWAELEQRTGQKLYFETGLVEAGPADGVVIPGVLRSAEQHNLEIEKLSRSAAGRRFPQFRFRNADEVVFERRAGFLLVEQCVLAHLAEAERHGAKLYRGAVAGWQADGSGVTVQTDSDRFRADRLVVTAGAWSAQLLADLGITLRVLLKHLHWYESGDQRLTPEAGCPAFFFETPAGYYYGFPQVDPRGVKLAEHSQGKLVKDPLQVDRQVDVAERARVQRFLAEYLPLVSSKPSDHASCFYTMSADEHFIVDVHPHHPQVVMAAGLSGHGFKFTSVLGEILAELAQDGDTGQPIEFLRCGRAALRLA